MATPAAILSILVEANTGKAAVALQGMQRQLEATGAHVTRLERSSRGASSGLTTIGSSARTTSSHLAGLAKAAIGVGTAFAAYNLAKTAITDTLQLGAATAKLTAITGLDAKTASSWIEIMKVRDVSTKQVALGFITFSKNIRNAEDGSKTALKAFRELGITQDQLRNESTQQAILQVADGLAKVEQPARRAALAQQLFGRNAQSLIPVLVQGRQGLQDALAAADRYGAYLPNNVTMLNRAREAQRGMNLALDGLKISFTTSVLPVLTGIAQHIMGFIGDMRAGKGAAGDIGKAIHVAFTAIGIVIKVTVTFVKTEIAILVAMIKGAIAAVLALRDAGNWLARAFTAAFGAIKGAVSDSIRFILGVFSTFLHGAGGVFNVASKIPIIGGAFHGVRDAANKAGDQIDALRRSLDNLPAGKKTDVKVNIDFWSNMVGAVNAIASQIGMSVTTPVSRLGKFPGRALGGLVNAPGYFAGEEAPRYPEVILASNPAYRQRNLTLWALAGGMLGVPGFQKGGAFVAALPPWTATQASNWVRPRATAWIRSAAGKVSAAVGPGGVPAALPAGAGSTAGNRALGRSMMLAAGWPASEWPALEALWTGESGWSTSALNKSSGAYGIPQALGHGFIGNTAAQQIAWGLNYIRGRYGSPSAAWAFWQRQSPSHWYRRGGILGRIPHFQTGGIISAVTGIPALPRLGGTAPTTIAGAGKVAGTISGVRSSIASLEHQYTIIDSFFNLAQEDLVDPDTGELNQGAINRRVAQLDQLISIRQRIFDAYGQLVALTNRLIKANQNIIAGLKKALASIKTAGLKGGALTSANKHRQDLRVQITRYQGNLSSAQGDLLTASNDRDSAWIDLLRIQGERAGVAATKARPIAVAGAAAPELVTATLTPDISQQLQLQQQIVTQTAQALAVSQAQYATLKIPFAGSFQSGGIVPGPIGAPRVIIAHGGETVGQPVVENNITLAAGSEWLERLIEVKVDQRTRQQTRPARRGLPGGG
jgi:hypothetical protein